MLQYERFEYIMQTLRQQSSVRVTDLAAALNVSDATIRRVSTLAEITLE